MTKIAINILLLCLILTSAYVNHGTTTQTGTFEIGINPESTGEYYRVRYLRSYCETPDITVELLSGPTYDWRVDINTLSGFVIVVDRGNTGDRETMRFAYTATGEAWPCAPNFIYIPLIYGG